MQSLLLVVSLLSICCSIRGYQTFARTSLRLLERSKLNSRHSFSLHYKAAKPNKEDDSELEEAEIEPAREPSGMVKLPQEGLIGYQPGSLFYKPIDIYDPLDDAFNLPGEDGSPEKIAAIEQRIAEKVEKMKASGEWDKFTGKEFGKDPLRDMPLPQAIIANIKAGRPFDSWGELWVTMFSVFTTIFMLSAYLYGVSVLLEMFVTWFQKLDFKL